MRTQQLLYLLEISKTRSINKASENLNISHQALNVSIKNLEDELNTCLLNRSAQGVSLTETGQLTANFATACLNKLAELQEAIAKIEEGRNVATPKGHLNLSTMAIPNYSLVQPTIKQFLLKYPQITIDVTRTTMAEILNNIRQQKIMLGFITIHKTPLEWLAPDCPFLIDYLLTDKSYIVMSSEHPLAKKKTAVTPKSLLQYPFVVYREGNEINVPAVLALKESYNPQIQITTNSLETFEETILSGQGIGFTSKLSIKSANYFKHKEKLSFIPLKNTPTPIITLLINKEAYIQNQKVIDLFLGILKSFI
ncbi:LysR family transcriptional regulator [Pelotomaculum propionicicum]|uniref:HTH-type transcriptional regulator CynR n=1 Tax=Pelotomaculum propionicicum TaxID=258475 RepID=A0A4Y7RVB2_9FIRM|nr:LysR family transcriptional regulator [Pelotomaculum propionicicum]NLI11118.1 LysR family transcriptional regulator [Peptococcaceae bacterium]TEB12934.1 HTH-type transcriptional regulator CynR [Pelotomaculum propionicicum]